MGSENNEDVSKGGLRGLIKKINWKLTGILAVVFAAGIIFTGVFNTVISFTNRMDFCTTCHTMQTPFKELQETVHYKSASGVGATCADCHVPKAFFPKMMAKVAAYKDVMHQILGTVDTKEKFEAYRWKMANAVWAKMKASDSRECRSCHAWDSMDLSEQDRSARKRHGSARDEGKTCIDCHKGIAHKEPEDPEMADLFKDDDDGDKKK